MDRSETSTGFNKARGDPDVRINMDDKKIKTVVNIPRIQNQVLLFGLLRIFCADWNFDNDPKLICILFSFWCRYPFENH